MISDDQILIVGANGQLGTALKDRYPGSQTVDVDTLDITSAQSVQNFNWQNVSVILNAAGYTNVDGAETIEGRALAWKVNALGTANLTRQAIDTGILIVHLSTDYVFDGQQTEHQEDEDFAPLGVYAQSKAAGDLIVSLAKQHYIVRTSWVIGEGHNFVRTMMGLGQKKVSPKVVSDQVGRLTFTKELVKVIDHLLTTEAPFGTYNATNGGQPASWADITREIFRIAGFSDLTVTDISTEEYYADKPQAAKRPLNSSLDLSKLEATGFKPTDWRSDLEEYVKKELSS